MSSVHAQPVHVDMISGQGYPHDQKMKSVRREVCCQSALHGAVQAK